MIVASDDVAGHRTTRAGEHVCAVEAAPQCVEFGNALESWVDCDERGIQRTDRAADEQIGPDAGVVERANRADLNGAERAATGQHECLAEAGRSATIATAPQQ